MKSENQVFAGCSEISRKAGPEIGKRICSAVNGLTKTPPEGDIKPLVGYSDGRYRLRVGGWRVIFKYDLSGELKILLIIGIGNRGDIYK